MIKLFKQKRDVLGLILRICVALALFVTALTNYKRLTNLDMRALVAGASSVAVAILLILLVYLIKSVLFVIPASLIYMYVGMAFTLRDAILVNLGGIAIEVTATYILGRFLGGEYVEKMLRGKKGGDKILDMKQKNKYSFLLMMRALPVFPIDFVSLFIGASKLKFIPYVLISLAGIMPRVILFTILGDGIYDYIPMRSIVFVIICAIPVVVLVWVIKFIKKKKKNSI